MSPRESIYSMGMVSPINLGNSKINPYQIRQEYVLTGFAPVNVSTDTQTEAMSEASVKGRSRAIIYIVLIAFMILALGSVWFFWLNTSTPILTIYPSQRLTSADWSGYSVSTDLLSPQAAVTSITGSWTVPEVSKSVGDSFSAAWIGIGGQFDENLIQVGTEHDWFNGSAYYGVWYELLPQDSVQLDMTLSPGDVVTASITLQSEAAQTWIIEISDKASGQTFRKSIFYPTPRFSAEWIVERPTVNNNLAPLADFGKITFTDCSATLNGKKGSITSFPHSIFTIQDRIKNNLNTMSDPLQGGVSFTVDFVAAT